MERKKRRFICVFVSIVYCFIFLFAIIFLCSADFVKGAEKLISPTSIIVQEKPNGSSKLAKSIFFQRDCILVDPKEPSPDYDLFEYGLLPRIFVVDSHGNIHEITYNHDGSHIRIGNSNYPVPVRISEHVRSH